MSVPDDAMVTAGRPNIDATSSNLAILMPLFTAQMHKTEVLSSKADFPRKT